MDGEDRGFAAAQSRLGCQKNIADDHSAFQCGVHAVIDGAEWDLGTCTGVHGVQVMYKGLHGLIGRAFGFFLSLFKGEFLALLDDFGIVVLT